MLLRSVVTRIWLLVESQPVTIQTPWGFPLWSTTFEEEEGFPIQVLKATVSFISVCHGFHFRLLKASIAMSKWHGDPNLMKLSWLLGRNQNTTETFQYHFIRRPSMFYQIVSTKLTPVSEIATQKSTCSSFICRHPWATLSMPPSVIRGQRAKHSLANFGHDFRIDRT